jgi:hypothetical protein
MAEHLGDRQAAHDFVVLLVTGDREEALAHRVFLMHFIGLDQRFGKNRRGGSVEHREQAPPVGDGFALFPGVAVYIQRIPGQLFRIPVLAQRGFPDFLQLLGLHIPGQRVDVGLLGFRRKLHLVGKTFLTCHVSLEKHRATLDGALNAIHTRGYWSAYNEMPSPKVYGETAPDDGKKAFEATWASNSSSTSPAEGWHGGEQSPYGIALNVQLPGVRHRSADRRRPKPP